MEELPFFDEDIQPQKLRLCEKCGLHPNICICQLIPKEKQHDNYPYLIILQDPREAKVKLNTVKLIDKYFKHVEIYKKNLPIELIDKIQQKPNEFAVLFPRKTAKIIDSGNDISFTQQYKYIIIIDGTWDQAKSIYNRNKLLHQLDTLILSNGNNYSQYNEIRKEISGGMSTFEATITTISIIMKEPSMIIDRNNIMKRFIEMRTKYYE
ncbi:hypothetical protein, conserved [Entamoeba dispar SAW760]|uniref:tRNA-uridine aminocarboxypropyltransferase n=1 Tax=Entamoeba dispar (strain ATCC PRA-260 / SAW760) TaxID=370354 RepID=B0E9P0_ENTDS|nr:uncharacterized protein EDI_342080 [Entamoeba dispar SAW760]EDR28758.1 hypothetical protein, conserved [Entamoeba dispar SAW760]|eukprot:EDR28758.1 hypothetical protein, conserved [Entamoeba dispar SAW760]